VLQARAATSEYERLKAGPLAGHELMLMHGQMRPSEKQDAMAAFASGSAQILVATTVIEVVSDIPNATVMLIEDADRYGISQLHQLRAGSGAASTPRYACCSGDATRGGCRLWRASRTASSWLRSTSSCGARASSSARGSRESPSTASSSSRVTPSCRSGRGSTAAR